MALRNSSGNVLQGKLKMILKYMGDLEMVPERKDKKIERRICKENRGKQERGMAGNID